MVNVDDFGGPEGLADLNRRCCDLAESGEIDALRELLLVRANGTQEKHEVPRIVAAALLRCGVKGVQQLRDLLRQSSGFIYPQAILEALWLAGNARAIPVSTLGIKYPVLEVGPDVAAAARVVVDDIIVEAQEDAQLWGLILGLQNAEDLLRPEAGLSIRDHSKFTSHVMKVIRNSSISLTESLIEEFADLIAARRCEAEYQAFLEDHPVFLDPLAVEVSNRARLGGDLVTDFVVRRHDGRYIVVEIEKPWDSVFTKRRDFSSAFTHAIGQVLDFQGWVSANVAYARTRLPSIENPAGLLVMGMRSDMSEEDQAKLRRWSANSRSIEVATFDDLLARARSLYASLRRSSVE